MSIHWDLTIIECLLFQLNFYAFDAFNLLYIIKEMTLTSWLIFFSDTCPYLFS